MRPPDDAERAPGGGPVTGSVPIEPGGCQTRGSGDDGSPVRDLLDGFIGLEIDGGCDDCNAYQTIERAADGIYINHVWHDDTCPWLKRRAT